MDFTPADDAAYREMQDQHERNGKMDRVVFEVATVPYRARIAHLEYSLQRRNDVFNDANRRLDAYVARLEAERADLLLSIELVYEDAKDLGTDDDPNLNELFRLAGLLDRKDI